MSTPTGSRGTVAAGSSSFFARRCEQQATIDQQREQQLNATAAEECRLRRLMQQHPPRTPDHGVFVLQADGRAGEPAEPMRQWDPRGLIDPIYEGKRRQRAVAKKAEDLKAKLLDKLDRIANMNDGVANTIRELKGELEKDHKDLHRLILNLNLHWSSIEDDIGREYGYDDPTDDQLKILGLAYTDAVKEWDREY
ncbi:hypothetical protein VTN96DRAFT_7230 [Rasamsonia emersonii]